MRKIKGGNSPYIHGREPTIKELKEELDALTKRVELIEASLTAHQHLSVGDLQNGKQVYTYREDETK